MVRLVAFLRGINVGGHIATKNQLQEAFISLGFLNVFTLRQSGNVIFETHELKKENFETRIAEKLRKILGYDVAVFLRTIEELKSIINLNPFRNQEKEGSSFLVTMLSSTPSKFPLELPTTIPKSTAQIISTKGTEVFSVTHGGGEGALPNPFIESKLKTKTTTRNMNIIEEIVEKFGSDNV